MIRVSAHAIERYIRRVEPVSDAEAICRLSAPHIIAAVQAGASAVILASGHKVVIAGNCIVTVRPKHGRKRRKR